MRTRPGVSALAALLLSAAACSSSPAPTPSRAPSSDAPSPAASAPSPSAVTGPAFHVPPPSTGAESAAAVRTRLCVRPPAPTESPAPAVPLPPAVAEAESQVQQVRGLSYEHPVAVDPVTHQELVQGLDQSFNHSYPKGMMDRRSLAWSTIGVIPDGTSLHDAIHSYLGSQVIGYYDPESGQLVFIGTDSPTPPERFTLAHELTHADDDQHFDLNRINDLEDACDDEGEMASLGAVEGSAVYFSVQVVQQFFSPADQAQLALEGGSEPTGVPLFVRQLEIWPYLDGPQFIASLRAEGGLDRVNSALERFPVSTEQVIHPEKFPDDQPVEVDVPDLGPDLGKGWTDLDVMDVGEEWLREALALGMDRGTASTATDGWGGGQYRAWSDGRRVAVLMETAWDTPEDARQFLDAARTWTGDPSAVRPVAGDDRRVAAVFASDPATKARLLAALR